MFEYFNFVIFTDSDRFNLVASKCFEGMQMGSFKKRLFVLPQKIAAISEKIMMAKVFLLFGPLLHSVLNNVYKFAAYDSLLYLKQVQKSTWSSRSKALLSELMNKSNNVICNRFHIFYGMNLEGAMFYRVAFPFDLSCWWMSKYCELQFCCDELYHWKLFIFPLN